MVFDVTRLILAILQTAELFKKIRDLLHYEQNEILNSMWQDELVCLKWTTSKYSCLELLFEKNIFLEWFAASSMTKILVERRPGGLCRKCFF